MVTHNICSMRVLRILNPNETFVRAETGAVQGRLFAVLNVEISSTGNGARMDTFMLPAKKRDTKCCR
jgi:hypothetical protein